MPKPTFDKISPEKRERFLVEAARLFAERGFSQTDMAELASRANVAKGSVYDYFDSKEDLYLYVCRDGLERSRRAVYGGIDPSWDLYRQITAHFQTRGEIRGFVSRVCRHVRQHLIGRNGDFCRRTLS